MDEDLSAINEIKSNVEKLELYSDQYPFRLSLRVNKFDSEQDYKKFIKNCEKLVRGSIEYRLWVKYIIDVLGNNTCMITAENMDECSIEVHHHIPSLYQAVSAIVNKHLEKNEEFSTFDICLESIEIHFENKIGYVCLINSMHEKLHNGALSVPKEIIKGNYMAFISEYGRYLDEEDMNLIHARLAVNTGNTEWTVNNYPGLRAATC